MTLKEGSTMLEIIPSGVWAIGGVIIGFVLNMIKDYYVQRPQLFYSLITVIADVESEYRTKTSPSDYKIEVYNCGIKPVLLNHMALYTNDGEKIIVDTLIIECTKILPYEKYSCCLAHQDYTAIQYYCEKSNLNSCKVIAWTVGNKQIEGSLDLSMFSVRIGRGIMERS